MDCLWCLLDKWSDLQCNISSYNTCKYDSKMLHHFLSVPSQLHCMDGGASLNVYSNNFRSWGSCMVLFGSTTSVVPLSHLQLKCGFPKAYTQCHLRQALYYIINSLHLVSGKHCSRVFGQACEMDQKHQDFRSS